MADELQIAHTKQTAPGGQLLWTFLVADQLVDANRDWSRPMQFKFVDRDDEGRLDLIMRYAD